jgi:hypothetical protein
VRASGRRSSLYELLSLATTLQFLDDEERVPDTGVIAGQNDRRSARAALQLECACDDHLCPLRR